MKRIKLHRFSVEVGTLSITEFEEFINEEIVNSGINIDDIVYIDQSTSVTSKPVGFFPLMYSTTHMLDVVIWYKHGS